MFRRDPARDLSRNIPMSYSNLTSLAVLEGNSKKIVTMKFIQDLGNFIKKFYYDFLYSRVSYMTYEKLQISCRFPLSIFSFRCLVVHLTKIFSISQ